jgi:hypothetical protein
MQQFDLNKQKEILRRLTEEYQNDVTNYNKFANINNYVKQNHEKQNNDKSSYESYFKSYIFDTIDDINDDIDNINDSNIKFNNIEFNFKRKHLLKIIHPDKIHFLFELNISNNELETNKKIIVECVTEILSKKLNLVNSLVLLCQKSDIFIQICKKMKMTTEQIDFIKNISHDNTNCSFDSYFDSEMVKFINGYNKSKCNIIDHINSQIYTIVKKFRELFDEFGRELYKCTNEVINEERSYLSVKQSWDGKHFMNDKLKEYYDSYIEMFNKYKLQYAIYTQILNKDKITIYDFVEICYDTKINTELHDFLLNVKNDFPYLYKLIIKLPIEITTYSITMPYIMSFGNIPKQEYNRYKYGQTPVFDHNLETKYSINLDISPIDGPQDEQLNKSSDKPLNESLDKSLNESSDKPLNELFFDNNVLLCLLCFVLGFISCKIIM